MSFIYVWQKNDRNVPNNDLLHFNTQKVDKIYTFLNSQKLTYRHSLLFLNCEFLYFCLLRSNKLSDI